MTWIIISPRANGYANVTNVANDDIPRFSEFLLVLRFCVSVPFVTGSSCVSSRVYGSESVPTLTASSIAPPPFQSESLAYLAIWMDRVSRGRVSTEYGIAQANKAKFDILVMMTHGGFLCFRQRPAVAYKSEQDLVLRFVRF
jgi:hypothetical protein